MNLSSYSLPIKIGISGTGYIATGFLDVLQKSVNYKLTKILSKRKNLITGTKQGILTKTINELVDTCDIIVDCSGNIIRTAEVVATAHAANKPVMTLGSEFHVTIGSYFVNTGYLTEAEGDQPGCIAALREEAVQLGFEPLVYGNIKGYLNKCPEENEMRRWSRINGISLEQTTAFTDGTKLQIEQALTANGLNGTIAQRGLIGLNNDNTILNPLNVIKELGSKLSLKAEELFQPIADYVIGRSFPGGIFITGKHACAEKQTLQYLKMGNGPYYTLIKNYHLCHLEMIKTLDRIVQGKPPLLNNSEKPKVTVIAIAKRKLKAGYKFTRGIGNFDIRGEAALISEYLNAVPIGLLDGAYLLKDIEPDEILTWEDVEIPDSLAFKAGTVLRELAN